jgi:hypothetical protein
MRLLLLRQKQTGKWKVLKMEPMKFESKRWAGYQYYKSFPWTGVATQQAKDYAILVEKNEARVKEGSK